MRNRFTPTLVFRSSARLSTCASIALAMLVGACGSSSSAPNETAVADAGGDAPSSNTRESTGDDAGPADYDAAVASCASAGGATAVAECCQVALPGGYEAVLLAEQHCVCGAGGTCSNVCGFSECSVVQGQSEACQKCLETSLAGTCAPTVKSACDADRACAAYEACLKQ